MDHCSDYIASNAIIPAPAAAPVVAAPQWALVEIFGHRSHYGKVREVEAFGAKLLEVFDVDTGKRHRYGGSAIFSMTELTQAEIDAHVLETQRRLEADARYQREYEERCRARAAAVHVEDEITF